MDWRRAKILLIAGFALLDVFLFWRVLAEAPLVTAAVETPPPVVQLGPVDLAGAGVELAPGVELPTDAPALALLGVRLQVPDGSRLAVSLFGGAPMQVSRWPSEGQPQAEIYQTASAQLAVLREGLVRYQRQAAPVAGFVAPAQARRQADDFVARAGGLPSDGVFDYAAPDPTSGRFTVRYIELYRGLPLFPGYWRVEFDRDGVVAAQRFWLDVTPPASGGDASRPTVTAAEALVQLAGQLRASREHPIRVLEVRRGYYSPTYEAAREWQLVPAWRVRLDGGSVYFVNAYTGSLEE